MSDELVKRLRVRGIYLTESDCDQAADRIESQDREIAELKRRLAKWESQPVVAWYDDFYKLVSTTKSPGGIELIARPTEE